jgi:hypothetical protein
MNCPSENGGEDMLLFKEVYYDEEGKPDSYSEPFMFGDDLDELRLLLLRLEKALDKPVLHENEFGGHA